MAKTKALISFAVTAKLIWVFVFAYAKSRFSHDAAHMLLQTAAVKMTISNENLDIVVKFAKTTYKCLQIQIVGAR